MTDMRPPSPGDRPDGENLALDPDAASPQPVSLGRMVWRRFGDGLRDALDPYKILKQIDEV